MDLLSRIASWLGENEATISAVVGITVLAGVVFAGVRSLVRRRGETSLDKATAGVEAPAETDSSPADVDPLTVPGFEGRPAIAVLAFDNLSGDPEQEYFADGIAEDLITRLSAWREFPVIARNSSFTYKGKPVEVKRVSRELGVRYVVEGSVRKAGEQVRITAQLIDATTGAHVWAERYDRELEDIFTIQDEITTAIAAAMGARLTVAEQERAASKPLGTLDGWESLMRGLSQLAHAHAHLSGEENARARPSLERAIELEPNAALPLAVLAVSHLMDVPFGWTGNPAQSLALGRRAAEAAVSLDNEEPMAHCALGLAHELSGQPQKAIAAYEIAIQLRPSYAEAYSFLAGSLAWDRPDEALARLDTAMHLSPRDSRMYHWFFIGARAQFVAGRDAETVEWAEKSLQRNPGFWGGYVYLAASCAHLERAEEARSAVEGLLRLQPDYSLARFELTSAMRPAPYRERLLDGLRKAGLPE